MNNIKCFDCKAILKNGSQYSLECDCGRSFLSFNKNGELTQFSFWILEDRRKEFNLVKNPYSDFVMLYNNETKTYIHVKYDNYLKFEDGIPQVMKLINKLRNLSIFQ